MMVRHYSHEAADLQPALEMLKCQNMGDYEVSICKGISLQHYWASFYLICAAKKYNIAA